MYLILGENNKVISISETLAYQENGNALIKNGTLAVAAILVKEVIPDVTNIPTDYEDGKYIYTNGSFTVSSDWKIRISESDRIAAVEAAISSIMGV